MKSRITTLLRQAAQLSDSHAKADLTGEAVNLADVFQDLEMQFETRMDHVRACVFSGRPADAIVAFTWLLNHRNAYGDHRDDDFLWYYKWIVDSVIDVADFSKAQVEYFITDARARYEAYLGPAVRPIDSLEISYLIQCGDFEKAKERMTKVEESHRGRLSDCLACERSRRAIDWFQLGDLEKAAALHDDILQQRLSCSEEPTRANSRAALYYATVGRWEDALVAHRAGSSKFRRTESLLLKCCRFGIAYKVLAERPSDAIGLFDLSLGGYLSSIEKWPAFEFFLVSHRLMEIQADAGKTQVRLKSAAHLPFMDGSDSPVPTRELSAWLLDQAKEIGAKFDARNDATYFAERVEARWPFVAGAP